MTEYSVPSRFSRVWLCATLWTVAYQAFLSVGFSRQEYWSILPCPPPGGLPDPGMNPWLSYLLHWRAGSSPPAPPGKPDDEKGNTCVKTNPWLPRWLDDQESSCNAGGGFNPWVGRSPREGNGNPFQYSCLENPMDRGACEVQSMGVTKSWTQLRD